MAVLNLRWAAVPKVALVVVAWARGHATSVIERIAEAPSLALGVLLFASYGHNSGGVSAVWSSLKALSRCE